MCKCDENYIAAYVVVKYIFCMKLPLAKMAENSKYGVPRFLGIVDVLG